MFMKALRIKVILILLFLLLFSALNLRAQAQQEDKITVMGMVSDQFLGIPLKAKVYLLGQDSTLIDSTTCEIQEKSSYYMFHINRVNRAYIIKSVMPGYDAAYQSLNVKAYKRLDMIAAEELMMKKKKDIFKEIDLKGVTVKATKVQVAYRGDTLVYDASAFVLPDGSMLDAMVRQMPGAEVKDNGDVYINGRKIDYLTLNGKDFFKGKNKVMLDNLPYFTVKDVKVFHKERTGIARFETNARQKDYVMDVSLKRQYIRSALANIELGAGTKHRNMARLFSLLMGSRTDIAVFGNANNINEERKPGLKGNWSPKKMLRGQKDTRQVGLYINSENKRQTVSDQLSSSLEWDSNQLESTMKHVYFSPSGDIRHNSYQLQENKPFKLNIDNGLSFGNGNIMGGLTSSLSYQHDRVYRMSSDTTFKSAIANMNQLYFHRLINRLETSEKLNLAKRFAWGDMLVMAFDGAFSSQSPYTEHHQWNIVYGNGSQEQPNYISDKRNHSYSYGVEARYHYHMTRQLQLTPYADFRHKYIHHRFDYYPLDGLTPHDLNEIGMLPSRFGALKSLLDGSNSRHYNSHSNDVTGGMQFDYATDRQELSLDIPLHWTHQQLNYHSISIDTRPHRTYFKFEPMLEYQTMGRNKRSFSYQMTVTNPELAMLVPYENHINPFAVYINNQHLKQQVEHRLKANLSFHLDSIPMNWWADGAFNYVHHGWGTRTAYDSSTGAFTYMDDNVNAASWNLLLRSGFDYRLDAKRRLTLVFSDYIDYVHSADFTVNAGPTFSSDISKVNTLQLGCETRLNYRLNAFSFDLLGKLDAQYSRSKLIGFQRIKVYDYQYGADVRYTVPGIKVSVASDLTMYSRRGYESKEMNSNHLVWNMILSRAFAKGLIITKMEAFDLFHQLSNKQYSVNAQGRTESWYNSIPRYFMFSVAITLNKGRGNKGE